MTQDPFMVTTEREPVDINPSDPHAARVYDYLVGGSTYFPADEEAAIQSFSAFPGGLEVAKANARASRAFLGRATRYLAREIGIRQFLDIGTGIPTTNNTHEVAQKVAPESRIVYVDTDPIVLAHAHALLRSRPEGKTAYFQDDLRDPKSVLTKAADVIDLDQPIGLMLVSILHMIEDKDRPYQLVNQYLEPLPPGSHIAIAHLASDIEPEAMAELSRQLRGTAMDERPALRSRDEVARFFDGLEMVEPGLVRIDEWRPESTEPDVPGLTYPFYAGVARKPV